MQVKLIVVLASAVVAGVFLCLGYGVHGLFAKADVGSFLGIVIAVNTSILFRRVRRWLFTGFHNAVSIRLSQCHTQIAGVISESEIDAMYFFTAMSRQHFCSRLDKLTAMAVWTCPFCACIAAMLYWVGVPTSPAWVVKWLHALLIPALVYFVSTVTCCLCMLDHCNELFGEYAVRARRQKECSARDSLVLARFRAVIDAVSKA